MPTFADISTPANDDTDIQPTQTLVLPVLMKHLVYPLCGTKDPTLKVVINNQITMMLLDTGAHVSVLPKSLLPDSAGPTMKRHSGRLVRAFGGQEIELQGPVCLPIHICGLNIVHPFYYLDLDTPVIGGYDLLAVAMIVINPHAQECWSMHPAASERLP